MGIKLRGGTKSRQRLFERDRKMFLKLSVIKSISLSILLVLIWSTCSNGASLSLEEKFQQLAERYANLEAKMTKLEAKDTHLEALIQLKDQRHEMLAEKVSRLEMALKIERETNSKLVSLKTDQGIGSTGKSAMPRTCLEAMLGNPSLNSGMHWIDPDGQGVGDAPIFVYCDMTSGSTSILHDSESPTEVRHCADPGCYTKAINYNATMRQMTALAELSGECHQSIKYDCYFATFEFDTIAYSWWNDKNGEAKYFWAGMNTNVHTCQCGIDGNCVEASTTCNCDSAAPVQLVDDGVITDKSVLPITRLNFGRTQLESSSGVHTLGRFECTGQVAVNGMPRSCGDLWRIGHTLSGLYSIMGPKMVESVYCDFTKLPNDAGFEKQIGYVDVKSLPTYFYVQKNSNFNTTNIPIPFEISKLNIGNAMNLTSGIFTAPRTGTYYFSFTGLVSFPVITGSAEVYLGVELLLNGNGVALGTVDEANTIESQLTPFTFHSTLDLKSGDQIWLRIKHMTPGAYLYDSVNWHSNHFTGWILEEDIVNSL